MNFGYSRLLHKTIHSPEIFFIFDILKGKKEEITLAKKTHAKLVNNRIYLPADTRAKKIVRCRRGKSIFNPEDFFFYMRIFRSLSIPPGPLIALDKNTKKKFNGTQSTAIMNINWIIIISCGKFYIFRLPTKISTSSHPFCCFSLGDWSITRRRWWQSSWWIKSRIIPLNFIS